LLLFIFNFNVLLFLSLHLLIYLVFNLIYILKCPQEKISN